MTKLLVASRNRKKLAELRRVLDGAGLSGLTLSSGTSHNCASNSAVFAASSPYLPDHRADSTPGMPPSAATSKPESSATLASPVAENASRALASALSSNVGGAAFVSACALVSGSGEVVVRGEWPGTIAREPRGDGGFGYDPVFVPYGDDRTAAQLSPAEKDAVSHRGRALALLLPALRSLATG